MIKCQQYEGNINGDMFSKFIDTYFPEMFLSGVNQKGKLFLKEGDPSQNCKLSRESMAKVCCRLFKIPSRSLDLNPIENIFHLVGKQLRSDAMHKDITAETFEKFSRHIKATISNFSSEIIDKTIDFMARRIDAVIKGRGQRTKYYLDAKCGTMCKCHWFVVCF